MTPINKIFDFGKFYLVSELADDATEVDIVAASDKYTMEDQRNPGTLFTAGRLVVIDKNDTNSFISLAFSNCVENGEINGFKRYTLTIRLASDGTTVMMGLANTDDGTNDVTNVIAANKTGLFPIAADSLCLITVGSAEYQELIGTFTNAINEIADQTNNLAMKTFFAMKQMEQRLKDDQDTFETSLQGQQTAFEASETAARLAFEAQMEQDFQNFVADQRQITAKKNTTDGTKVDISSGNWLDGNTARAYAGVLSEAITLNNTTYLELSSGSGALSKNNLGFTVGAFPIAIVVADASEVTSVTNYGAAYLIAGAGGAFDWGLVTGFTYTDGLLTGFTDGDSVAWTITYDSDGQMATITDGTDTTTITRDASGDISNISYS